MLALKNTFHSSSDQPYNFNNFGNTVFIFSYGVNLFIITSLKTKYWKYCGYNQYVIWIDIEFASLIRRVIIIHQLNNYQKFIFFSITFVTLLFSDIVSTSKLFCLISLSSVSSIPSAFFVYWPPINQTFAPFFFFSLF